MIQANYSSAICVLPAHARGQRSLLQRLLVATELKHKKAISLKNTINMSSTLGVVALTPENCFYSNLFHLCWVCLVEC